MASFVGCCSYLYQRSTKYLYVPMPNQTMKKRPAQHVKPRKTK